MNRLILSFTRNPAIPMNLRRKVGNWFCPKRPESFSLVVGDRILYGSLDNYIDRIVYLTGDYFEYTYLNLLKKLVRMDGCVLDIGANVGNHSIHFSTYFEKVFSFEPYPPVFEKLRCRTKGIDNIYCYQLAISDAAGVLKFQSPLGMNWGTGKISFDGDIEVQVGHGDTLVQQLCDCPVRLVKIDTEGYELEVLDGLKETLQKQRPVVVFEVPKTDTMSRSRGFLEASKRIPDGYVFYGLRSQSTFPIQIKTARKKRMARDKFYMGCKLALAVPEETTR
jgi:FkbM family methyltransferase